MNKYETKIVVISKSYEASLGIARALKKAGFSNIDLIFVGNKQNFKIVSSSNIFNSKIIITTRDDKKIINVLINNYYKEKEKVILFSGDDYTTSLFDKNRSILKDIFIMPYVEGNYNSITKFMDKAVQNALMKKYELEEVKSWTTKFFDDKYIIPEDVIYPCFVKPLISANGLAKVYMAKCDNREDLVKHMEQVVVKGEHNPFIIQEFINIKKEYLVHGICNGNIVFTPICHEKIEIAEFTKGVTVVGKNLKTQILEPELSKMIKLMTSMNYHGPFNLDIFCSEDKVYLNEINMRIAGSCGAAPQVGANIPAIWVELALSEDFEKFVFPECDINFDTIFINDKTAYEDLLFEYKSKKQLKQYEGPATYHLIKDNDDILPWKEFKKMFFIKNFKKNIKKILHK